MKMNLTTDPWIPVVCKNGLPDLVSLTDAYQRGEDIQDLAVRPHERIALMRLLICVAQAALDGPKDHSDWQTCRSRIATAAAEYLKRSRDAFELFGDKQRFLQVPNLRPAVKADEDEDGGKPASKLDLALSTDHNSTLFDNAGGSDREFTPAQLAMMLLTFQCFSPSGRIGVAEWSGKATPGKGSSDHAPCLAGSMLHALLRGATLLETIHRNALSKETVAMLANGDAWGRPSWEQIPVSVDDQEAVHNATATYLGRLVPFTRAIRLHDDGASVLLANGLEYPPYDQWRETTCTIVVRQRRNPPERAVLGASIDRAPWRELHALAVRRVSRDTNGGPVALQNVSAAKPFDLWVGGLVADKAKLLDTVEAVFHVPANMLTDTGQRLYEAGVRHAEMLAYRLGWAALVYRKELGDDLARREAREQATRVKSKAAAHYWTDIEREVQRLLDVVADPASVAGENGWPQTTWGRTAWKAAMRAFDVSCPHDTPRRMRAFALARQTLFRSIRSDTSKDKPQEVEA